jgi:hypothetical protein
MSRDGNLPRQRDGVFDGLLADLDLFPLLGNGNFTWPLAVAERGRVGIGQAGRLRGIARAKRHGQRDMSHRAACKGDGQQQDRKALRHRYPRDRQCAAQ